jgi:hypothetical protein
LSIAASSRSDRNAGSHGLEVLRFLDFAVLAIALPVFVFADLPFAGYLVGGGAWILQRIVQLALQRRAAASDDPRTTVGLAAASMIARGWIVALAIFAVGLSDNDAGLAAAVLVIVLFTVYFAAQFVLRPLELARRP